MNVNDFHCDVDERRYTHRKSSKVRTCDWTVENSLPAVGIHDIFREGQEGKYAEQHEVEEEEDKACNHHASRPFPIGKNGEKDAN